MLALCSVVLCSRPSVPAGSASADAEVQLCYTVYTVLYKGYGHLWIFFFFFNQWRGREGPGTKPLWIPRDNWIHVSVITSHCLVICLCI